MESIKNFKEPSNATELKFFLGLSGYYRKFIKNFSTVTKPLTELTKKNLPSTLATTRSFTQQELLDIWKKRHEEYLEKGKMALKKSKKV